MESIDNLLYTKLNLPEIGIETIWRNRLLEHFNGYEYKKLTIVSAPTGYGKTVLISQFVTDINKPVVWYQLDEFDNDINLFFKYFIVGISKRIPHFGIQTLEFIEKNDNAFKQIRTIVALLVNELEVRAKDGLEIILDDYHLISEKEIHKFIEELMQFLPKGVHLVISTRHELPINIVRLKTHGLVNEIKYNHLRFSKNEIRMFFNGQNNNFITEEIIAKYEAETDGWPVALSLMKTALKGMDNKKSLLFQWENREDVYNYFAEEVFQQLSIELQAFLVNTSVLDVLTPDICNILTERKDSNEILEEILLQNIFLIRFQGEERYYRYHHLFKYFLEQHLGDKRKILLEKVGDYFTDKGYYEQAIENYILSGIYERAVSIIEKVGIKMIKEGNWQTINRWMQKIPPKNIENSPYFTLLRGVMYNQNGMWDEALIEIDKAIEIFANQGFSKDLVDARFQKAIVLRRAGRLQESVGELNEIIINVNNLPLIEWYDVVLEKVNTLLWSGALNEAVKTLKRGIEFARRDGEPRLLAYFMENLGATYYAIGDYYKAIKYYQTSKDEYLSECNSISEFEKERYSQRTTLAVIYRDWGELDKALELIREEIDTKEKLGIIDDLPRAYHQLALICNDKGDKKAAERYFQHSDELYEKLDRRDFQWTWHLALYGKILIDNGKREKGKELIEKSIKYAEKNSEFNLALCEFIGCYAYIGEERIFEAIKMLEHALKVAKKIGAKNLICQCCWALSNVYASIEQEEKSKDYVAKCLELAREGNYLQVFLSNKQTSFSIIKLGIEMGIEEQFLEKIVLRLGNKSEKILLELLENNDINTRHRAEKLLYKVRGNELKYGIQKDRLVINNAYTEIKPLIYIYCFDSFEVYGNAETNPVKWKTMKSKELFAYFIKNINQTINKEKILEDIWPEMNPEQTTKWLHTYVYQIRSVLKSYKINKGLIYKNNGYCLQGKYINSDIKEFENLFYDYKSEKIDNTIESLKKAIDLYRGDYLTGFYNNWIIEERNRLEDLYMVALERLTKIYMELKDYKSVVEYLQISLKKNPLLEDAHEMLMISYEKMGDRMAVINHYEIYCNTLKSELGIQPKKEMKCLYEKLIRDNDN